MKNYKTILFLLLALFGHAFKAQEVNKPAEVFGFYFNTFIKYDHAALVNLNNYLRPTVEGKDAYQINFQESSEQMIKVSTDSFLSMFPANTASACKVEAENYFRALSDNFKQGKLSVKEVKLVQNEYVQDQKIANIAYSVSFKVPSKLPDLPLSDPKKVKSDELKKYLAESTEKFKNADKIVTTEQEFSLYELKEGTKIYYWNGSPDKIVSTLTDFYFENFGGK
ncbi:hypothetical protein IQ37_19165 [Chryseobacterium piperi]|uniref:DUF5105 domain-containing protein n=1 Tax=Chryseobacterium piperi TaxID=558152 RepID=A0A086AAK1_9FLAO|nr:hypothetical protein [Chryseobacterium piperi]ASW75516.1 hypothetical protein CJF12_15320 [Chryseobacterium piperi]KFF13715.1 hypothetical protein IQ37_19165 [Chryseobacterium piperi]